MTAASRVLRAFLLATWLYSLLLWAYIAARIIVNEVNAFLPFLDVLPVISTYELGIVSFVISFLSMVAYLALRKGP